MLTLWPKTIIRKAGNNLGRKEAKRRGQGTREGVGRVTVSAVQ